MVTIWKLTKVVCISDCWIVLKKLKAITTGVSSMLTKDITGSQCFIASFNIMVAKLVQHFTSWLDIMVATVMFGVSLCTGCHSTVLCVMFSKGVC